MTRLPGAHPRADLAIRHDDAVPPQQRGTVAREKGNVFEDAPRSAAGIVEQGVLGKAGMLFHGLEVTLMPSSPLKIASSDEPTRAGDGAPPRRAADRRVASSLARREAIGVAEKFADRFAIRVRQSISRR